MHGAGAPPPGDAEGEGGLCEGDAERGRYAAECGGEGQEDACGQGDGGGDFQRARDRDDVEIGALFAQGVLRPFQQGVGQIVIEARLNDEDAERVAYDWSSPSMSRQPTMRRP